MVSSKGKAAMATRTRILEDPKPSKNIIAKDFKIYSGKERTKAESHESGVESSRKGSRKVSMAASRKSVPGSNACEKPAVHTGLNGGKRDVQGIENLLGKCDNAVKVRTRRKALADVSNVNNERSYQLRNHLSSNPQLTKKKSDGSSASQGKTNIRKCSYGPRMSLTKSVIVANASSRKPSRETVNTETRGKLNISGEPWCTVGSTRKKVLSEINICRNHQRNHSNDGSKVMNEGVKLRQPRVSLATQKVKDRNTLSRKPLGTKSKAKATSMVKHAITIEKSTSSNPSEKKEGQLPNRSSLDDNASAIPQGRGQEKVQYDSGCYSQENVTATISRHKHTRRKSYTSSLVTRSEIMGESASLVNKHELLNIDNSSNPLDVVEYVDDIYQYYWSLEVQSPSLANYMIIQSDITPRMRGILINWLIEVHLKFELMQETLFLMVELLDRVLSVLTVKRNELQMVGLTCLLLASKYEDFWHPKIGDLISISANLYTRDQMLAMERLVLTKLKFRLNIPTPYVFMLRFLKAAQSEKKLEHLAFYLIELCLVEYEALKFKPSLLCSSAIYVARCTLQITPFWTGLLRKHARYEESQLRECASMILGFQRTAARNPTKITYEKFLRSDHDSVAATEAMDKLPL
ncbi:putative cyclin-B3-1 [Elaeis guineensis]|uniref:Cyclin-B3-1 isoform X2 n=1 Tax=Elaeis guineensis var. tenera TaxID=51953 RepID=A0A6J0PC23_ELAGV|nr:putative cyclin-B3-1 isoform X2 [Elaeis guineensis]